MKRHIENGLAAIAAVIVLVGVSFAARTALADESQTVSTTGMAIHTAADRSVDRATAAQVEAVADAADALASDNRLDLDIRLAGHQIVARGS